MAAVNGTLTFLGNSGRTYIIDIYCPDAAATQMTFNPSGAAALTSPSNVRIPENGSIFDVSMNGAPTASGAVFSANSGAINGGTIRHANQSNALATRQKLRIPLKGGDILTALQF